jgi:hypothetical protein
MDRNGGLVVGQEAKIGRSSGAGADSEDAVGELQVIAHLAARPVGYDLFEGELFQTGGEGRPLGGGVELGDPGGGEELGHSALRLIRSGGWKRTIR